MPRRMHAPRRHVDRRRSAPPSARPSARRDRSSRGSLRRRRFRCRPNERRYKERTGGHPDLQVQRASSNLPFGIDQGGPGVPFEEPRYRAFLDEVLEYLLVLQGIHRAPEAFVPEGHELVGFDQALEWRLDEFIAFAHVVEYLLAEDEEAAVDPEIGVLAGADALNLPARPHVNQMQAERRPHRGEAGDLSARAKRLDHFRQIDVGKAVA